MPADKDYDALAATLDAHAEAMKNDTTEGGEKKAAESQASTLVAFVRDRCRLVHDENGEVYAIENATKQVRNIERKAFKTWLHAEFYTETKKAARSQSVAEALTTLTGIGLHDGESVEVHIRCAALGDGYVINLGEPGKSRAIVVRPGGWTVTEHHGVMFTRPDSMKRLPEPVGGGTFDALWSLVNVPESSRLLVTAWLLDCLRPDAPFPLLEAIGEQGSAKSGLQKLLKRLIDPSAIELRAARWRGCFRRGRSRLAARLRQRFASLGRDAGCSVPRGHRRDLRHPEAVHQCRRVRDPGKATRHAQRDRREAAGIEAEFDRLHPELPDRPGNV